MKYFSKLNLLFLILLIIVFIFSCKKDETSSSPVDEFSFVNKRLKVYSAFMYSTTDTIDIYSQLPECKKDDITNFTDSNFIILDNGILKCNQNEPQYLVDGKWHLSNEKLVIISINLIDTIRFDILSESKIRFSIGSNLKIGNKNYYRIINYNQE